MSTCPKCAAPEYVAHDLTPDCPRGSSVMITGAENIEMARWLTVRSALKLEIRTGMLRSSRGASTLQLANQITGRTDSRKTAAYKHLNAKIVEAGGQDKPL